MAGGSIHSRPYWASGSASKIGEVRAKGWIVEQTSCTNPGIVSSADRTPPPNVGSASKTMTFRPAWAMTIAAARPLGPDPTTMASRDMADGMAGYWSSRFVFERALALMYLV